MSEALGLLGVAVLTVVGLGAGAYLVAVLDGAIARMVAGEGVEWRRTLATPVRGAALLLLQERTTTERPDAPLWALAPAMLAGLAASALALVPLGPTGAVAEVEAGIVGFGALGALV
ncbi:MAG: hypothetical protein ABI766_04820, partial [Gemmatimonadales bacterium]